MQLSDVLPHLPVMVTEARAGDDCDGGTAPQMAADWDYNDARRTWQRRLWEMEARRALSNRPISVPGPSNPRTLTK